MMTKTGDLLSYDPAGSFLAHGGISPEQLTALGPALEDARREFLGQTSRLGGGEGDAAGISTTAAFFELPERQLDDYVDGRQASDLGQVLRIAQRLRETVDRVVVLGGSGWTLAARAVLDACCEPHFNELTRGQRGCRPRIYFAGNHFDNDAAAGLRKLLTEGRSPARLEDRWALIALAPDNGPAATAVAFQQFLAVMRDFYGADARRLGELVVCVTGPRSRLPDEGKDSDSEVLRGVPERLEGPFGALSVAGLLPAAVVGLDVVRLLEGASAMNDHFRTAPPGRNAVLDFVGVGHLMESQRRATMRILQIWAAALESVGRWYSGLLAEKPGRNGVALTALAESGSGDLRGPGQPHQPARRSVWQTNLIVDQWRCDPWAVDRSGIRGDPLHELAKPSLPDLTAAAIRAAAQALREAGHPAGDLRLPRLNEYFLGQLLQMLMIATAVERCLKDCDPPDLGPAGERKGLLR